jgi:hypothetical protein
MKAMLVLKLSDCGESFSVVTKTVLEMKIRSISFILAIDFAIHSFQ